MKAKRVITALIGAIGLVLGMVIFAPGPAVAVDPSPWGNPKTGVYIYSNVREAVGNYSLQDTYPGDSDVGITFPSFRGPTNNWPRLGYHRWDLIPGDRDDGAFLIRNVATGLYLNQSGGTSGDPVPWVLAPAKSFEGYRIQQAARNSEGGLVLYDSCLTSAESGNETFRKVTVESCRDNRKDQSFTLPKYNDTNQPEYDYSGLPLLTDAGAANLRDSEQQALSKNVVRVCNHGAYVSYANVKYTVKGADGAVTTKDWDTDRLYAGDCINLEVPAGYITGNIQMHVEDGANCGEHGGGFLIGDPEYNNCSLMGGIYTFSGPHADILYEMQGTSCYPTSWSETSYKSMVKETQDTPPRVGCPDYSHYFFGGLSDPIMAGLTAMKSVCGAVGVFFPPAKLLCLG
ncbi:hypothetical protein [Streptomyces sp. NPDC048637]|uniref:hypothetical protein n=1 Tax=Streptomyces sp. NPDC048637 TaxID=3155636 RepID=UPI003434421B